MPRHLVLAACFLLARAAAAAEPSATHAVIGTGAPNSIYDTYGKALCTQIIAAAVPALGCETRPAATWQVNLDRLESGEINFALISSDRLADLAAGAYDQTPSPELRAVLALPGQLVTILARSDGPIQTADDLSGRRVRTAPPPTLGAFLEWMQRSHWGEAELKGFGPMGFENSVNAVCDGVIEAFIFVDGHPGEMTDIATARCPLRLVPLADERARQIPLEMPEFVETAIPAGLYPGQTAPVASLGTYTVLLTQAGVPDALVAAAVGAVLDRFDAIRGSHKAFSLWSPARLRPAVFPLAAHKAADKVFAERGLLKR